MITVMSFGYGHAPAPEADLTVDLRNALYNPHHDPRMRELTGLDPEVREHVLATPGAHELIARLAEQVRELARQKRQVTVAIGCSGGRHRSVVVAEEVAAAVGAAAAHRDVTKPVLPGTRR